MCKILNESSTSTYIPIHAETHDIIHAFTSSCSEIFISNPQWFACEESSTELQTSKIKAKTMMRQANVVENTTMRFMGLTTNEKQELITRPYSASSDESNESWKNPNNTKKIDMDTGTDVTGNVQSETFFITDNTREISDVNMETEHKPDREPEPEPKSKSDSASGSDSEADSESESESESEHGSGSGSGSGSDPELEDSKSEPSYWELPSDFSSLPPLSSSGTSISSLSSCEE